MVLCFLVLVYYTDGEEEEDVETNEIDEERLKQLAEIADSLRGWRSF